jgi:hypothetical protein
MTVTALKATILGAAVSVARKNGLHRLTRLDVATAAECGTGTVSYHFGDMDGLSERRRRIRRSTRGVRNHCTGSRRQTRGLGENERGTESARCSLYRSLE